MGKTAGNAVWLDPNKTSPYDFFQYWRNVDDADVIKCMKLLTFIPLEEIEELSRAEGSAINAVKERLAYEITKLVHGQEEAAKEFGETMQDRLLAMVRGKGKRYMVSSEKEMSFMTELMRRQGEVQP